MPYQRVWVPELNQWKIIGEDTGEYAAIYSQYPGATQINIPASTGEIVITQPGQESMTIGEIPIAGQITDLTRPYDITPYTPTSTPTPTTPGTIDKGSNVLGLGGLLALALGVLFLSKRKK